MGIPLEEYAEASFEIITIHALPMITDVASETMLRRDMTNFPPLWAVPGVLFGCTAVTAALLSGFSIATARAEETAVPKRSAYPQLPPPAINKPGMTAADQEKLKKELSNAAARAKTKKP
jgi:hypothetical protein